MNLRLKITSLVFLISCFALITRLFYWQIIMGPRLATAARDQYTTGKKIIAERGNILSSDETALAASVDSWLLHAYLPDLNESPRAIANRLAPITMPERAEGENEKDLLLNEAMRLEGLLERKDVSWIPLKRNLTTEIKQNIEAMKINGIGFDRELDRFYPEASSAAHILGFVGKDDNGNPKGYFGLEGFYDLTLSGKHGYIEREANPLGIPIFSGKSRISDAAHGIDLITNIDKFVERVVEVHLKDGLEKYGASAGTVIVENPENGAILAMASYPSFDPEKYSDFEGDLFRNPAISDSFEPGSIFKPIIMAAGLDVKVVEPDTKCDLCGEPLKIDKYEIKTWNNKYEKDRTMTEVIVNSDNVGMAFVGEKLGEKKMHEYLDEFGFGKLTGIDLQGEMTPALKKKDEWSIVDTATISFGQGIAITPIQMISAVTTIARKGVPVAPQVVNKLSTGTWESNIKPKEGKRVISEKAASQITEMLVQASANGEAKWTALKGFKVAGKTGTAQIPVAGHYDEESTIASFVGFVPANNPEFVMLVTLREPQSSQWASETAAPLWYAIAKDLFPYFHIQPEN